MYEMETVCKYCFHNALKNVFPSHNSDFATVLMINYCGIRSNSMEIKILDYKLILFKMQDLRKQLFRENFSLSIKAIAK